MVEEGLNNRDISIKVLFVLLFRSLNLLDVKLEPYM